MGFCYFIAILTARGASSPAKPALHIPEPLSITSYNTEMISQFSNLFCLDFYIAIIWNTNPVPDDKNLYLV